MPRAPKRRRYMVEEDLEDQSESHGLVNAQDHMTVEEYTSSSSTTCSSSFPSSFSTSSSCYPLESTSSEDEFADAGILNSPQSSYGEGLSPIAMATALWSPSSEGSDSQREENLSISQGSSDTESLLRSEIDEKVADLVQFLLLKYQMKEPTTKAEMLSVILRNHQDHFPVIFREASECMQLVFGIDMKEVDPVSHSYVLLNTLGLTYDGMLSEVQGMPKAGLLVLTLSIIFMEGNCASEEVVWEAMGMMGVWAGMEHFIYGEPRKLITEDWVQEQYLEYRQVPNTDPAHYEFLWGPRAYAETSKMSILEFVAKVNESDPRSFPVWYEEALRDEEERAQAMNAQTGDTTDLATASSSTLSSSFLPN